MRRLVPIHNKTIEQMINKDGIIETLKKLRCNEKLSFIGENVKIGDKTVIYHFCNIFGNSKIGKNCIISSYVEIQGEVSVGNNCRIGSHSFLCSGVTLEDDVFLGSHIVTINDLMPKSHNSKYKKETTLIKKSASIGSGAVLLGGIEIGENAVVGAGAIVTESVSSNSKVKGLAAREDIKSWIESLIERKIAENELPFG